MLTDTKGVIENLGVLCGWRRRGGRFLGVKISLQVRKKVPTHTKYEPPPPPPSSSSSHLSKLINKHSPSYVSVYLVSRFDAFIRSKVVSMVFLAEVGWKTLSARSAECGVRSAECGVRSVENEECGKCGVWKMWSVWKCKNVDRFIHFKAFQRIYST